MIRDLREWWIVLSRGAAAFGWLLVGKTGRAGGRLSSACIARNGIRCRYETKRPKAVRTEKRVQPPVAA